MLEGNELRILKVLLSDFTRDFTIKSVAEELKQKYPLTHRTIHRMKKKGDITLKKVGNYQFVKLNLMSYNIHYVFAEMKRAEEICKRTRISVLRKDILKMKQNFVCVLFGSQVDKNKPESDVDLLFIIPNDAKYEDFERLAHNTLIGNKKVDVNIVWEKSMFEMWKNPQKLTVGNEIFKKHIVLYGGERFLSLVREYYVG